MTQKKLREVSIRGKIIREKNVAAKNFGRVKKLRRKIVRV